jgi:hypothetical protein
MGERAFALPVCFQPLGLCSEIRDAPVQCCAFRRAGRELVSGLIRLIACGHRGGSGCGELAGRFGLAGGDDALRFARLRHQRFRLCRFAFGHVCRFRRFFPAREDQAAFCGADVISELAIAFRRARLPPQLADAIVHIAQHFIEAAQIGLGRAEFLFGILAADVQTRNACGFLQHRAPVHRLGGDHGTDLALADQCWRMGPGCRISEQQPDILGPHIAAIDAIG